MAELSKKTDPEQFSQGPCEVRLEKKRQSNGIVEVFLYGERGFIAQDNKIGKSLPKKRIRWKKAETVWATAKVTKVLPGKTAGRGVDRMEVRNH